MACCPDGYAELGVTTNFSFLRGASHPGDMVCEAHNLGLDAIGIADRNTFSGIVRAHVAAKDSRHPMRFLVGVRLVTMDGWETLCYPTDRAAYGRLCRLLSTGNRRALKGECHIDLAEIVAAAEGQIFIAMPEGDWRGFTAFLRTLAKAAPGRTYLGARHDHRGHDRRRLGELAELARRCDTPMVATTDALYHTPTQRPLQDVLTCIREKCTIAEAGFRLEANAERHLKSADEMRRLFRDYPDAVSRTAEIANACRFSLDELKYEYPDEPIPEGKTAQQHLADLVETGKHSRYPKGVPGHVEEALRNELGIIEKLDYARYFLTVHDVVRFARGEGILCQGRGSAANSSICFCLGITSVDPAEIKLLFSRFISSARKEPPDIDVDFEHERREEVIQYLYNRYGRERAAICATVIHYRPRSAVRDVGKALGLTEDMTEALADTVWGSWGKEISDDQVAQAGLDPTNPVLGQTLVMAQQLMGFPRHLSQHVGGFVLTRGRLDESVPIGNAAMDDRTFLEWDKDDIDALGMMKVDVLALGMLTCIKRGFDFLNQQYGGYEGKPITSIADIRPGDKPTYDMLSEADSVGVFQVESRAQMSMLPRLKPQKFYDLVVEVAIVRPGPIQGDMVHPYLRRRDGLEPVTFPSEELRGVLGKTYGIPLFQEHAMEIAIVAAKFTPDEADGLRRAMATFRHNGTIHTYETKFIEGMVNNGYERDFAERCFSQIKGFGEYGFPESHAASFALLVYVSAWMKKHYPEVFCAAILNSQPMGFYQPAQLVRDAKEHGVEIRHPDINESDWDCTLEPARGGQHQNAVRLGLRLVKGLKKADAERLMVARGNGYGSVESLQRIPGLNRHMLQRLAEADAFQSLNLSRREALWAVRRVVKEAPGKALDQNLNSLPLFLNQRDDLFLEPKVALNPMGKPEEVAEDYVFTGLSLKDHPCRFFRPELAALGAIANTRLHDGTHRNDKRLTVSGLVLMRQQPGTAKGVIFLTLEDETGIANIIVWRKVFQANRRIVMQSRFMAVTGRFQVDDASGKVIHIIAEKFHDLTDRLPELRTMDDPDSAGFLPLENPRLQHSRDFH